MKKEIRICANPSCGKEIKTKYVLIASDRPYINLYFHPGCKKSLTDKEVESLIWKAKLAFGKKALGRDDYAKAQGIR